MAIAALDLGRRRIGVAVTDAASMAAHPIGIVERRALKGDLEAIAAMIRGRRVSTIVVGLPLNMDGSEGPRAQATRAFVRNLSRLTTLPFVFWDERLSTAAVTRSLIAQDVSRAKRAEVVDRMAAAYILQGALDWLNQPNAPRAD